MARINGLLEWCSDVMTIEGMACAVRNNGSSVTRLQPREFGAEITLDN
jgi:hypothetical protein